MISGFTSDFGIAFYIGSYGVRWYSILIFTGFLLAYIASIIRGKMAKIETKYIEEFIFILFPVSIVFARLWFVLGDIPLFLHQPFWNVFDVTQGGLAIQGGVVGGVLAGYFWFRRASKRTGVPIAQYADIVLPNVLLGQAIGRWGNFFNQEVLGHVAHGGLPFWLPSFIKDHLHLQNETSAIVRQPLFLYESFFDFMGWIFLGWILPLTLKKYKKIQPGTWFSMYFIYYGLLRAILEPFRVNEYIMKIGSAPVSVILSVIFMLFGIGCLVKIYYGDVINVWYKYQFSVLNKKYKILSSKIKQRKKNKAKAKKYGTKR